MVVEEGMRMFSIIHQDVIQNFQCFDDINHIWGQDDLSPAAQEGLKEGE